MFREEAGGFSVKGNESPLYRQAVPSMPGRVAFLAVSSIGFAEKGKRVDSAENSECLKVKTPLKTEPYASMVTMLGKVSAE